MTMLIPLHRLSLHMLQPPRSLPHMPLVLPMLFVVDARFDPAVGRDAAAAAHVAIPTSVVGASAAAYAATYAVDVVGEASDAPVVCAATATVMLCIHFDGGTRCCCARFLISG